MVRQFGLQRPLDQSLGQLLQEAILNYKVLRPFVARQQGINQLVRQGFRLYSHRCPMQDGIFLPNDPIHKTSYTLSKNDNSSHF
jgi:hypothetical protein